MSVYGKRPSPTINFNRHFCNYLDIVNRSPSYVCLPRKNGDFRSKFWPKNGGHGPDAPPKSWASRIFVWGAGLHERALTEKTMSSPLPKTKHSSATGRYLWEGTQ